jgi:hypothetical protein
MRIRAMAFLISLAMTLVAPEAADASVYSIDLTADMAAFTASGGTAPMPCNLCIGGSGFVSPFFSFPLGGTVDFGQVTIFPIAVPGFANEESSTWAMLLIGFAAIGFVGYRKSRGASEIKSAAGI